MEGRPQHPLSRSQGSEVPTGHQLILRARAEATISGVVGVVSFDDRQIVLGTQMGTLTITGHDLQIRQLDLGQGSFRVEGTVDSRTYSTGGARGRGRGQGGRGVLQRLFQ